MNPRESLLDKLYLENPDLKKLLEEVETSDRKKDLRPRVVVCGLLKAGKSSILNAITGNLEKEFFATNAARATIKLAEFEKDNVIYVDTPGIDATDEDDEEAWRGLVSGDILLFVHGLRSGELHQQELDFLAELAKRTKDLSKRMVVVLSRLDECEGAFPKLSKKINDQISSILEDCPPLLGTSFTRYRKGVVEEKKALIEKSGIPDLEENVRNLSEKLALNLLADRAAREVDRSQKLAEVLEKEISLRENKIRSLKMSQSSWLGSLKEDIHSMVESLRSRIFNYDKI